MTAKMWSKKYGVKPYKTLTSGTIGWYKWCSKQGRRTYLKRSRIKYKRFMRTNPSDLSFRVFKSLVLSNKRVSPTLMLKFKRLISKTGSVKLGYKYRNLTPQQLYNKMKG